MTVNPQILFYQSWEGRNHGPPARLRRAAGGRTKLLIRLLQCGSLGPVRVTFMPLWKSFPTDTMHPFRRRCLNSEALKDSICLGSMKMYGLAPPKDFITKAVSLGQGATTRTTEDTSGRQGYGNEGQVFTARFSFRRITKGRRTPAPPHLHSSTPPHLLTSTPPHLLTSTPPHLHTSSPPHLHTSSPSLF